MLQWDQLFGSAAFFILCLFVRCEDFDNGVDEVCDEWCVCWWVMRWGRESEVWLSQTHMFYLWCPCLGNLNHCDDTDVGFDASDELMHGFYVGQWAKIMQSDWGLWFNHLSAFVVREGYSFHCVIHVMKWWWSFDSTWIFHSTWGKGFEHETPEINPPSRHISSHYLFLRHFNPHPGERITPALASSYLFGKIDWEG